MVERTKIFYFTVFFFVVIAFVFHINAMGHHHWKHISIKNNANVTLINTVGRNDITIGLFTQCRTTNTSTGEECFPNMYPRDERCYNWAVCRNRPLNETCRCDYLPSTKGITACTIIAAVFLGLALLILFLHSIKTTSSRSVELILSLFPVILLLLAFIFILIALILIGSYLSRDVMTMLRTNNYDLNTLRNQASNVAHIQIGWSSGLEIIALFFSFLSFILYTVYVFKIGRSS